MVKDTKERLYRLVYVRVVEINNDGVVIYSPNCHEVVVNKGILEHMIKEHRKSKIQVIYSDYYKGELVEPCIIF